MAYDYTSLTSSRRLVSTLTGITDSNKLEIMEQNLIDSAALKNGITYYRPYYVAARHIQRNRLDQAIKSADGATFTNLETMVRSFLEEQLALDLANDWTVPDGFSAQNAINALCGCKSNGSATNIAPIMSVMVG